MKYLSAFVHEDLELGPPLAQCRILRKMARVFSHMIAA
jgi:hypothetical protein